MKALSIKQPWANMIASGEKTVETRLWGTRHRGDLLIVSSKRPPIAPAGFALAVVMLMECRPMEDGEDEDAACCGIYPGAFAWVLDNVRRITPFPVRGQLGLFEVALPEGEVLPTLPEAPIPDVPGQGMLFEEVDA